MINRNFAELDNENVTKLYYDINGIPSIMIGVQKDGTSRIIVSKPGIDVTTAAATDLAFNSAQNVLKAAVTGTTSISVTAGAGYTEFTAVVSHSLGVSPIPLVFADPPGGSGNSLQTLPYQLFTYSLGTTTAPKLILQAVASVDSSNLLIVLTADNSIADLVGTYRFKYYLLQETAN